MLLFIIDTYATNNTDIDTTARVLSNILQIRLDPDHTNFLGDVYQTRSEDRQEKYTLMANFNEAEKVWRKPEAKQFPLIFQIQIRIRESKRARIDEIGDSLKQATQLKLCLIRREESPD